MDRLKKNGVEILTEKEDKNNEKEFEFNNITYERDKNGNNKNEQNSLNAEEEKKYFYFEKGGENEKLEKCELTKENIMKIINTQDFVGGVWDINEQTKIIKEKYEKEFELLKNIKDKNIDDKIAITILIIYFINKEHSELLKELVMIIKKGKLYIQEKTKDTYENIIKEIGI